MEGLVTFDGDVVIDYVPSELQLSHSSRSISCDRKFEFRKLYPRGHSWESLPGEVGHCLHEAYQVYAITGDIEAALIALMLRYPIHLNDDPANGRSLEACYATFMAMRDNIKLQEYQIATINCIDGVERPAVEVPFKINITDTYLDQDNKQIPISYIGFIDIILFHILTNEYMTMDIKSTRDWAANEDHNSLLPKFTFDEQVLPYGLVLEHMLGRIIKGYKVNYLSCFIDIQKPNIVNYPFDKTQLDIQDFLIGLKLDISRYQQSWKAKWFRRTKGSCLDRYGKQCEYFKHCHIRNKKTILNMVFNKDMKLVERVHEPWIEFNLDLNAGVENGRA